MGATPNESISRGSVLVGNSSGKRSELDASTSGQILVGDGSDLASVAVSGDLALSSAGAATIQANAVEASMLGANLGKGFIPLDIFALREIVSNDIHDSVADETAGPLNSGGILSNTSTPLLQRVNTSTDKAARVVWGSSDSTEVQFPPVPMPPDLDESADVTVHLLAKMASGGMDTPTIDIQVFDGIGDTEMGGATAALSTTLAEVSATLDAANISGHPTGVLNISLVPAAHTNEALELYAAWVEYTRKT